MTGRQPEVTEHCRRKAIHSKHPHSAVTYLPMPEDSLAPNCGAGGSRCNEGVWQWSVAKMDPLSGSFAGRKRICMELASSGSGSLVPLNAIRTKPLSVQLS